VGDSASKSLGSPDETRTFDRGSVEVVKLGGHSIGRANFEPGWRWSDCVKPIAGTDSCKVAHVGYVVRGRLHVRMDDGTEMEVGAGDAYSIAPGHDGWVVGDEPFQSVEFESLTDYAKSK
jgi:hypothetical protein